MRLKSFFLGGFECSSHRRQDGRRLDLIEATGHDRRAAEDYAALAALGVRAARDGLRWHLIEGQAGRYDWSSLAPMIEAACAADVEVVWDLCHYGWPDHLDVWSDDFAARFADFAAAAERVIRERSGAAPRLCAVNEISFWAWAGGDMAQMNPLARGRGDGLKRRLVRAALAASRAIRAQDAEARFACAEPLIHVGAGDPSRAHAAAAYTESQFEAVDLWLGRREPDLGGHSDALDWIGVNYYPHNQWAIDGPTVPFGHCAYRPLSLLLEDVWRRYRKPILVTETGAEGSARAAWLHYVCDEIRIAMRNGAAIAGVCLYPILDYPGWDNDRICPVGLLSLERRLHAPLAEELRRQQKIFARFDARAPALAGAA